jgi:short-subunit dehydrogenase
MQISGTTVLLTGATGGLGRAIARAMADRGATLVLSSRKAEELERLAAERLVGEAGDVDILVANAGLPGSGRIDGFTAEEISRAVRVNLEAPMIMARLLMPSMIERGEGHLVFVSSLSGRAATARAAIYNGTKFGLRGFALALRQDLAADTTGVSASVVSPGFIRDAGMFADSGASPPPGAGTSTPEEVGAAVVSAVEGDRGEVVVAPPQQRALAGFAHHFPGVAARLGKLAGTKVADDLASGQTDKR